MNNARVRILALAAGGLAVGYILCSLILFPILGRLDRAGKGLESVRRDLAKIDRELSEERGLQQKLIGIRVELAKRDEAKINKTLVQILDNIGRSHLKANIRNSPETKRTDNFSEIQFTIEGEGSIEGVSRMLYELTYLKDYFRLRHPGLTSREGGKVQFNLVGSALTSKAPPKTDGVTGLALPEKPPYDKFKAIAAKNIFAPHASLAPKPEEPPKAKKPEPKKVEVRVSAIVAGQDRQPEALLESQGKSTWVKKGDKFGRYMVVDVRKEMSNAETGARDLVVLARGKSQVTVNYGETAKILHDDEADEEDVPSK